MIKKGLLEGYLSEEDVLNLTDKAFQEINVKDRDVLIIIPDHTRTAPLDIFFKAIYDAVGENVKKLDYLVALGTHPPISKEDILELVGISYEEYSQKYSKINFYNHEWNNPLNLVVAGTISKEQIFEISNGLMKEDVDVTINKLVFNYDVVIIVGPVFPHEVVGFSGGNKYFFPGISGPDVINFTHWLGAVITNIKINGTKDTPVRRVIDEAGSFLRMDKICFSFVVHDEKLSGLFIDTPEKAWSEAADLSEKLHIVYKDKPFKKVLGIAPKMYDDIWTAGKVMYKLEPVMADGGELIIYAPHISEISYVHGKILRKIGYHVRDYFLKQMDKFSDVPRGIMAHSTHVKGIGTFENNIEIPRVNVCLATSIPEDVCEGVNLGYVDYKTIDIEDWKNREDEGILFVPKAGEILHRVMET